jgi:hypothetical protein
MESLKVLHYYLDDCKVACVLITNNALDAAKMNRAVVVYRQSPELEELIMLLAGSMGFKAGVADPVIKALSRAYYQLMEAKSPLVEGGMIFSHRFGLRDFYSTWCHTACRISTTLAPMIEGVFVVCFLLRLVVLTNMAVVRLARRLWPLLPSFEQGHPPSWSGRSTGD